MAKRHYYTITLDDILLLTIDSKYRLPLDRLQGLGFAAVSEREFAKAARQLHDEGAPADIMVIDSLPAADGETLSDKLVNAFQQIMVRTMMQIRMREQGKLN